MKQRFLPLLEFIRFVVFVLVLGMSALIDQAAAEGVITDLTADKVPIEWDFNGAKIFLFGAIEGEISKDTQSDVIVVVRGPSDALIARKKERTLGLWVNRGQQVVDEVPLYYSVASSRPLLDIAPQSELDRLDIGFQSLVGKLGQKIKGQSPQQAEEISEAVVRLLERQGLYKTGSGEVKIVGDRLFQVSIQLEANVPSGLFYADVYLFRGGKLLGRRTTELSIHKSGFERILYNFAYQYPFSYGVVAVIIAVISGLLATAVFKED